MQSLKIRSFCLIYTTMTTLISFQAVLSAIIVVASDLSRRPTGGPSTRPSGRDAHEPTGTDEGGVEEMHGRRDSQSG